MLWLNRLIFLRLSLSMNSRIFCYQVIPCLQWLQKWFDVNHAVNNTPVQKADATANCRAWDAQWSHNNLSASVRSLGLSPISQLLPGRMPWLVAQGLSPLVPSQLNPRTGRGQSQPTAVPTAGKCWQHHHRGQTATEPAHAVHSSNIYPLFQSRPLCLSR